MTQAAPQALTAAAGNSSLERVLHDQAVRETRRRGLIAHAAVAVGRAVLIGAILGLWAYAAGRWVDSQAISDPAAVAHALYDLIVTGRLWPDLWQTVFEVLAGYAFGALTAVLIASLFAIFPTIEETLRPFLIAVYSIPKVALAPLMIMWFGLGNAPKIILAGGFVFFIVFMNVVSGIQSVNRNHINIVRVMGGTRVTVLRKIVFPTAIPFLFLGLRLAIPAIGSPTSDWRSRCATSPTGVRMWWRGSTMGRGRCSRSIRIWMWCRQAAAGPPILSRYGGMRVGCSAAVPAMPKDRSQQCSRRSGCSVPCGSAGRARCWRYSWSMRKSRAA